MPKNMFDSEKATQIPDLPHQFAAEQGLRSDPCRICQAGSTDPRHLAWEEAHLREKAREEAPQFVREIGS